MMAIIAPIVSVLFISESYKKAVLFKEFCNYSPQLDNFYELGYIIVKNYYLQPYPKTLSLKPIFAKGKEEEQGNNHQHQKCSDLELDRQYVLGMEGGYMDGYRDGLEDGWSHGFDARIEEAWRQFRER